MTTLLSARNLTKSFPASPLFEGIDIHIRESERMGLIGESGSGKTTLATALMRLSRPPAFITGGQVFLEGLDLMSLEAEEVQKMRLKEIAMVPQAAMNALNPVMRVDAQIKDALVVHLGRKSGSDLATSTGRLTICSASATISPFRFTVIDS